MKFINRRFAASARSLCACLLLCTIGWLVACNGAPQPTPKPTIPPTTAATLPPATAIPSLTPTTVPSPTFTATLLPSPTITPTLAPISLNPPRQLTTGCWVAYSPTNYDPNAKPPIFPPEDSIRQDLQVLRQAGFTGLVTYSASGTLGTALPRLAQEAGYRALIMGIWSPTDPEERANAVKAAQQYSVTVGFVIGNEQLNEPNSYKIETLKTAMNELRHATGKPVATTEQSGDYGDPAVLELGDWVFPNAHPYFEGYKTAESAVAWTQQKFADLQRQAGATRLVIFKEVGEPTDGDLRVKLDESLQAEYYTRLWATEVKFVYFEAFDQPRKQDPSVEPYWGLFKADRTPKLAAQAVCGKQPVVVPPSPTPTAPPPTPVMPPPTPAVAAPAANVFNVYSDAESSNNHFIPSGFMGDTGDIAVIENWAGNPHSGTTAIKVTYDAQGRGPNSCDYAPPCKWGGVYWQDPPNNWGNVKDAGRDLRAFKRLTFWARADTVANVKFFVGGIAGQYPDSQKTPISSGILPLTQAWQKYTIDLKDADLSRVIGGFGWAADWQSNGIEAGKPKMLVFYLDDIRFEQ